MEKNGCSPAEALLGAGMTEKQHSAEKDLLRLIENPGEAELKKSEIAVAAPVHETVKKISLFSFAKRSKNQAPKKTFDLLATLSDRRLILKVLFAAMLCAAVYFVVTVAREYSKARSTKNLVKFTYISDGKEARTTEPAAQDAVSQTPAEADGVRDIFKLDSVKKEDEKKDGGGASLADYRLVGISFSSDPKEVYAMIKNVKTNITFFLKKNEKLDGMELVNILDNRIVLNVKGKDVELR